MQRIVSLSHFELGTAPTEVYQCVVIRKGRRIVPVIERELRRMDNPCESEFGQGSPLCRSGGETEAALQFYRSEIESGTPCEIVP